MRYYLVGKRRLTPEERDVSPEPHRHDCDLATFDDLDYMRKHAQDFTHGAYDVRIEQRDGGKVTIVPLEASEEPEMRAAAETQPEIHDEAITDDALDAPPEVTVTEAP